MINPNIGRQGPALSATSDMPAGAPAVAAPPAAPEAAESASASADAKPAATGNEPGEGASKEPAEGGTPPKEAAKKDETPAWQKAEITKERNRRREADERAAAAERRLDEALKLAQPREAKAADKPELRPSRDAFDDPAAYEDALIEWSSRRATEKAKAEAEAELVRKREGEVTEAQAKARQAASEAWEGRRSTFMAEHDDYTDVAENPAVQISLPMALVITKVPNGPAVAYHFGKHPEDALRISQLPPDEAMAEVHILSRSLAKAPKAEFTKAPEPPKPLGSRSTAAASKSAQDESMEEYAARRDKEIKDSRRRASVH